MNVVFCTLLDKRSDQGFNVLQFSGGTLKGSVLNFTTECYQKEKTFKKLISVNCTKNQLKNVVGQLYIRVKQRFVYV